MGQREEEGEGGKRGMLGRGRGRARLTGEKGMEEEQREKG